MQDAAWQACECPLRWRNVAHHHLASGSIRLRIAGDPAQDLIEALVSARKTSGSLQRAVGDFQLWGCRSAAWLTAGRMCLSRPSTRRPFPSVTLAACGSQGRARVCMHMVCTHSHQWPHLNTEPSYSGRVFFEPQLSVASPDAIWTDGSVVQAATEAIVDGEVMSAPAAGAGIGVTAVRPFSCCSASSSRSRSRSSGSHRRLGFQAVASPSLLQYFL